MGVLSEQQAASKLQQLTTKILGDVRHSYLNNMDSLASAIGQEVQKANNIFLTESCKNRTHEYVMSSWCLPQRPFGERLHRTLRL